MENTYLKCLRRLRQQVYGTWKDSADDEWKRQNEAANQIPMYRLVYLSGMGLLVMKYHNRFNNKEFEEFLRREVRSLLYDGGDGKVIEEWDYIQYRKNVTQDASKKEEYENMSKDELTNEFREYQRDAINQFKPHMACMDINQRGAVGETILHLCYLNNTDTHRQIAEHLLKLFPTMVYDIYEGADYYGESALHIAIINNRFESVKLLVGKYGAELDRRATGRFFRPHDLKERKAITLTKSNYEGHTYYGEYPLAFAACTDNTEMYDYLINASFNSIPGQGKVDPNAKDSFGNTVIHMTIIHNLKVMFHHAINHSKKPGNYEAINRAGLTPLQLSYQLGRDELFSSLLDLTSQHQWSYGTLSFVAYPLAMLDSIGPNGKTNQSSALTTIIRADSTQHLKMLEGKVIKDLLQKKWQHYARNTFYFKFFWALLHLSLLSLAVYLRPEKDLLNTTGARNKLRLAAEACVIICCIAKTKTEVVEIISRGSFRRYLISLYAFPFKALFLFGTLLLFLCIPCRFLHMRPMEDILTIMSLPLSWSYIFFFFRGMRTLGPLIVMIGKMCAGDLMRFSIIYIIFLFTFAKVFSFLYKDADQTEVDDFETWRGSIMTVFLLTVGEFDTVTFKYSRLPWVGHIVYIIFLLLVPVMMLSMLIAMMGRTYGIIEEISLMQWNRQWAMIVLNMERSISKSALAKHQHAYSEKIKIPWSLAIKKCLVSVEQAYEDETGRDANQHFRLTVTFKYSRLPWVGHIVYIIFLLLVPVMMLSMLIAMMGRTYGIIEEISLMQWNRQWAMIVLNMERSISKSALAKHQHAYSEKIKIPWSLAIKKCLVSVEQAYEDETGRDANQHFREVLSQPSGNHTDSATVPLDRVDRPSLLGGKQSSDGNQTESTQISGTTDNEEKFYYTQALLVTKQMPKSRTRIRREAKQKWRWACRLVIRKKDLITQQNNIPSMFELYQKEKTVLMSTRDSPRKSAEQNTLATVKGRVEPSILHYVHPSQKLEQNVSREHHSYSKMSGKNKNRSKRNQKNEHKSASTPTEVQFGIPVSNMWSTGQISNLPNVSLDGKPRGGSLFPPSPIMPRFRNTILHSQKYENGMLPPFGRATTLSENTPLSLFAEAINLPSMGRPVHAAIKQKGKDKKRKSKKRSEKQQVTSISGT